MRKEIFVNFLNDLKPEFDKNKTFEDSINITNFISNITKRA